MGAQYFFYFLVILKSFIPDCFGSPLIEPLSSHNDSSKQANCDLKYPAFTGSSYLALDVPPPHRFRNFNISMEVKATEPVTDGILMYCAEETQERTHLIGFMSLTVRQGRLEFTFLRGGSFRPLTVLTANTTLPANEWTNIEVSRVGHDVSLRINSGAALEGRLSHSAMYPNQPLFIGGADESTILRNYTYVSGGFKGCIKHAQVKMDKGYGDLTRIIDIENIETAAIKSSNVQKCCDGNDE